MAELTAEIKKLNSAGGNKPEQNASTMRKIASRLCAIGTMEACECVLKVIGTAGVQNAAVAKYGLTTIANCTVTEEARAKLISMGAGENYVCGIVFLNTSMFCAYQVPILNIQKIFFNS